jgi:hypothetical protein
MSFPDRHPSLQERRKRSGGRLKADPGAPLFAAENAHDPVIYTQNAHEPAVAGSFGSDLGAIAPNPRIVAARAAS